MIKSFTRRKTSLWYECQNLSFTKIFAMHCVFVNDNKKKSYQPAGVIVVKFDESLDVAALPVRRVEEGSGLAVAEVDVVAAAAPLPLAVQGCVGGTQRPCNIPRHCHTSHGADYLEGKCGSSQDRGERDGSVGRWSRTASKQFRCSNGSSLV